MGKTRSLFFASALLIALMVALCVLSTLTASVLERRRDFALMKALGSSQHLVNMVFLGESLVLACAASVIGYITGAGVAAWIGRVNFHAAVVPRLGVFPIVLLGAITIAIISSLLPLAHLQKLEPAMMLKGD